MAALNFKITNAGLGLLSQVGAIGPVTLTKVAIGSAGYTPSGTEATLTAQIKQITPEGSSVPTPGIIHITASDSSTDAYAVKEIGLYAGTTLFAIYSQTTLILTKSSGNVALFSIDLALTNVPAGSVTIGSASFQYPPATESVKGVAEIATTAEVAAGTNDSHIVTPLKLAGYPGFVKKSGDTMTGLLTLSGAPTSGLQAATKNYVDTADALKVSKSGDTMTGLLTLSGAPTTGLHAATKTYVDTADALKVSKSGDTMTGLLTLSADPSTALHAATKQYVDTSILFTPSNPTGSGSGWVRLAGGLIFQWKRIVVAASTSTNFTWPIAFPTAVLTGQICKNGDNNGQVIQLFSISTTGGVADNSVGAATNGAFVLGIGY